MDNVSVSMQIAIALSGDNSDIAGSELGIAKDTPNLTRGETYSNGSGSGECDVIFHAVLAITTLDEVDFNGVVLKDAFGEGLAITKLKGLFIKNLTGGALTIGDAANPMPIFGTPIGDTLVLADNASFLYLAPADGLTIGAGSGELEFVHAEGGAQSVEIIAVGAR